MSDNELIAQFMGWRKNDWGEWVSSFNGAHFDVGELHYDKQWDWLMPVVEKIERIKGIHTVISELGCDIYSFGKRISDSREDTKLKTVYKAVVKFIKFHNSQK